MSKNKIIPSFLTLVQKAAGEQVLDYVFLFAPTGADINSAGIPSAALARLMKPYQARALHTVCTAGLTRLAVVQIPLSQVDRLQHDWHLEKCFAITRVQWDDSSAPDCWQALSGALQPLAERELMQQDNGRANIANSASIAFN